VHVGERRLQRAQRLRRGTERVLVGGQLDRVGDAVLAFELVDRLAGRIRLQRKYARPPRIFVFLGFASPSGTRQAGYDPSTFTNKARRFSAVSALVMRGSSAWPARSMKKTYSQARPLSGRDSMVLRLMRCWAKQASTLNSAPASCGTANRIEVLSSPVGRPRASLLMTRNPGTLLGGS